MNKNMPPNCRIGLVLKHSGSYFVQMFALYVGGGAGVTGVFLNFPDFPILASARGAREIITTLPRCFAAALLDAAYIKFGF